MGLLVPDPPLTQAVNRDSLLAVAYRETAQTRARRDAMRERVVSAASAQVAEAGYASASVQAVARRARVATGSVYRHFPSKADLFAEVFRRASQRELDVVIEVATHEGSAGGRGAPAGEGVCPPPPP